LISTGQASPDNTEIPLETELTYEELWARGEYHSAVEWLETNILTQTQFQEQWNHHLALLLFEVGRVEEAIELITELKNKYPEPYYTLNLALMHQYKGHTNSYRTWLNSAASQIRNRSWYYRGDYRKRHIRRDRNVVAMGRIFELMGTNNPKTILSAHYKQHMDMYSNTGANVYTAAGDLAFRTGTYDVAASYYEQALEKDPAYQEALAGLVECFWKSHDPRLEGTMEMLLSLNPNHPRVHKVKVERHLEMGQLNEALAIIDAMLAINPVSHTFRAFKASALYLGDELDEMQTLIDEVQEYCPVDTTIFRMLGRFASRHYRFKDGAKFQRMALDIDPDDYAAQVFYGLDLLRVGEEAEARIQLTEAFAGDPYNVQAFNLLEMLDSLDKFAVVEHGDFVLKLPENEKPVMAIPALELLDEAITHFEAKYEIELEKPILIEMFDQHDDFMVRSVGLPGNVGHLGICFGKLITMDTPSVRPRGSSNWRSVLWHEFVHVITLQKTNNRMPRWLSEGISVYEEGQYSEAFHNRMDPDYRVIIVNEGLPKVADIDAFFTRARSSAHLMFGYFIAGEFTQFYVDKYGFKALVDSLEAIGNGAFAVDSLAKMSGEDVDQLNTAWHAYLEERLKPFESLAGPKESPSLLSGIKNLLSPSDPNLQPKEPMNAIDPGSKFVAIKKRVDMAIKEENWDVAIDGLNEAYEAFPDYNGPDNPLHQLAEIYRDQGEQNKYIEQLTRIAENAPSELGAVLTLLDHHKDAADWDAMLEWAQWAIGIDPYSAELHRTIVEGVQELDRDAEALPHLDVLTHVDEARGLEYQYLRADVLATIGERDAARMEVLKLLEEMPHYRNAQDLLLRIHDSEPEPTIEPNEDSETEVTTIESNEE
jgi:tetratricopeptide (TPR) repeat protein